MVNPTRNKAVAMTARSPLTIKAINNRKVTGDKTYELHIVDDGAKSYWYVTSTHGKKFTLFQSAEFYSSRANAERSAMKSLQAIYDNTIIVVRDKGALDARL